MSRSAISIHRLSDESGMGLIEAMTAAVLLLIGILATFGVLDGARTLTTTSERKEVALHRAQREIERVRAIPFDRLELAAAPGAPVGGDTDDPRSWVVSPNFDWDRASAANTLEPLVVEAPPADNPDAIVSRRTWSDGRQSGTLDTFISAVDDELKRVTVAVRLDGPRPPRRPIVLTSLVSRQAGARS